MGVTNLTDLVEKVVILDQVEYCNLRFHRLCIYGLWQYVDMAMGYKAKVECI